MEKETNGNSVKVLIAKLLGLALGIFATGVDLGEKGEISKSVSSIPQDLMGIACILLIIFTALIFIFIELNLHFRANTSDKTYDDTSKYFMVFVDSFTIGILLGFLILVVYSLPI